MKRFLRSLIPFIVLLAVGLGGCAGNESEALRLVHAMMKLDYANMPVGEFNAAIESLCENAGTTVSQVYHDVSEEFTIPGDTHGPPNYDDETLKAFMTTTLQYSSTEIAAQHAGEAPAHMGVVMYLTAQGKTAKEVAQIMAGNPEEAAHFVEDNAETLNPYPILLYYMEGIIHDAGAITVSERDTRVNSAHATLKDYFLGLTAEEVVAEALEEGLETKLEALSVAYSDAAMTVHFAVQGVSREGDLETSYYEEEGKLDDN